MFDLHCLCETSACTAVSATLAMVTLQNYGDIAADQHEMTRTH